MGGPPYFSTSSGSPVPAGLKLPLTRSAAAVRAANTPSQRGRVEPATHAPDRRADRRRGVADLGGGIQVVLAVLGMASLCWRVCRAPVR